jgi:hypothetical protein
MLRLPLKDLVIHVLIKTIAPLSFLLRKARFVRVHAMIIMGVFIHRERQATRRMSQHEALAIRSIHKY